MKRLALIQRRRSPATSVLRSFPNHLLRAAAAKVPISPRTIGCWLARSLYHHPSKITFEAVRNYALPLREPGGQHALIKMAEQIVPPNLETTSRYRTIQQDPHPSFVRSETGAPLPLGRKLAQELPHGHLEVLKDCGHAPQEAPRRRWHSLDLLPFLAES